MRKITCNDPVELIIISALEDNDITFVHESQDNVLTKALDFYLPDMNLYIEVARGHTSRKIEQLSRVEDVIYKYRIACYLP